MNAHVKTLRSIEAPRVHYAARRSGGSVAARHTRAAARADAAHRLAKPLRRCSGGLLRDYCGLRRRLGRRTSRPGPQCESGQITFGPAPRRYQRVSPVVALALGLLLARRVAASATASARALAKQL